MKLWLSDQEVQELTGMKLPSAQMRVLDHIGLTYLLRPDNTFIVPVFGNFISDQLPVKQDEKYKLDFSGL